MRWFLVICLFALVSGLSAQQPKPATSSADTARGDALLEASFRHQVQQIARGSLADLDSRASWEKERPQLHKQFLDMMGLWPMPPKTDLKATITGTLEMEQFVIEKIHFQSSPGLYVTGNLYRPRKVDTPLPGILYVCGHGANIIDGISYGNKVTYQHHGAWFAEHGYVCLMIDTLQLGELQGLHHGTNNLGLWWWHSLGYTPAGIELWNGIRALDYLQSRREVDPKRLGVTGRSGGGATSWWVAAADERIQAAVPVAGIGDLQAHVVEGLTPRYKKGVISGHCDCMYFVNTYRWDFDKVAALIAPRPLLLGNSDDDAIFPVPGYRRMAEKVRKVYSLYGASDKFDLLETQGPHKDTPELRAGAYRWMNRWLKGDNSPVTEREAVKLPPQRLKVVDRAPADVLNASIHESFLQPATVELPRTREEWQKQSETLKQILRTRCFGGWPQDPSPRTARNVMETSEGGLRLRVLEFSSEPGVDLRLGLITSLSHPQPEKVEVRVLDEGGWQAVLPSLPAPFLKILQTSQNTQGNADKGAMLRAQLERERLAVVLVAPRGIGPTRWSEAGTRDETHVRRRYPLLGQTLEGQRIWDVRRALGALNAVEDLKGVPRELRGTGEMAGIALYAAIFEPETARVVLTNLPPSHRHGPMILNVLRVLDTPQALGLLFPRPVELTVANPEERKSWSWPLQLQQVLGGEYLKIRAPGK